MPSDATASPGPTPQGPPPGPPATARRTTGSPDTEPGPGPLDGFTVLDLSVVGPATRCSRALADYGATVVKVGPPPRPDRPVQLHLAYHAYSAGRGQQQARVDLRNPDGVEAFLALAAGADVVLESFRPGVVDRLGIGYDAVKARNPGIVYCSTSGYGQDGPHAQRAGHDLNYLAVGGFLHTSGRDGSGAPALPGATVADIAAGGLHAATAILAALVRRERCGEGSYLDVSVADGVAWMTSLTIDEHLATGTEPAPGHNILTGRYACYGIYPTRDGKWLTVAAIEPAFWANLCRLLDLEKWADRQLDDDVQDTIRADLTRTFLGADRDTWTERLADADTCVAPVHDIAEVVTDPQYLARGAVVAARHPGHGEFRQLAPLLAGAPRPAGSAVPDQTVTHTDELLRAAGYPDDRIAALRTDGVIA